MLGAKAGWSKYLQREDDMQRERIPAPCDGLWVDGDLGLPLGSAMAAMSCPDREYGDARYTWAGGLCHFTYMYVCMVEFHAI